MLTKANDKRIVLCCRGILAIGLMFAAAIAFAGIDGTYLAYGSSISIESHNNKYAGEITLGEQVFPYTATATDKGLAGKFTADDQSFEFSAEIDGDRLVFKTGQTTLTMQREKQAGNPFDQLDKNDAPAKNPFDNPGNDKPALKPVPAGIEGKWQDEWLYYEFANGVVKMTSRQDASATQSGTYKHEKDQLTMTFNGESVTVACKIDGNRMVVTLPDGEVGELSRVGGAPEGNDAQGEAPTTAGLNGQFEGKVEGVGAVVTIESRDGAISGQINVDGYIYTLAGKAEGNQATGQLTDSKTNAVLPCEIKLDGGTLTVTLAVQDPSTGQTQRVPLNFTRKPNAEANAGKGEANKENVQRDKAIVGVWRYTYTQVSGDFSIAVDTWMTLNADGTFRYGDSKAAAGGDAGSVVGGGGDATVGTWMTKDKVIYAKEEGGGYEPYAKYYVEDNSLMFTFDDGSKQIWNRQ